MSMLHYLSIRTKQWIGFGLMLCVLSISFTVTLISLDSVEESVNQVVHESQPRMILTADLSKSLKQSVESLGFYLLTKEEAHLDNFSNQRDRARYILQSLITKSIETGDNRAYRLLKLLNNELKRYQQITGTVLRQTAIYRDNYPGMTYANRHIYPISRRQVQLLSQMILSEMEEPSDKEHKQMLYSLTELRYAWSNIMNGIHGHLALRSETDTKDKSLHLERIKALLRQIDEKHDQLSLDQDDAIEQFAGNLKDFETHYRKLLNIHGSDQWRSDAWLVRTRITPLLATIDQQLDQLLAHHQASITDTSIHVIDNTRSTTSLVSGLLILTLLLGILISWLTTRLVCNPIIDVVTNIQEIANGNDDLTRRLVKRGDDELGPLTESFNLFVEQIRQLIQQTADALHTLADEVEVAYDETVSHHDWAFGEWYYAEALPPYRDIDEIHALKQPLKQLHSLTKEINNHIGHGDIARIGALYNVIEPLPKEMISPDNRVELEITDPASRDPLPDYKKQVS